MRTSAEPSRLRGFLSTKVGQRLSTVVRVSGWLHARVVATERREISLAGDPLATQSLVPLPSILFLLAGDETIDLGETGRTRIVIGHVNRDPDIRRQYALDGKLAVGRHITLDGGMIPMFIGVELEPIELHACASAIGRETGKPSLPSRIYAVAFEIR